MTAASASRRPVALVTGASSGIGAEYAKRLAERGYDLVLVARSRDRLNALGAQLARLYRANTVVLAADLSRDMDVEIIEDAIRHMPRLRVLVNAAGFLTKGRFAEADAEGQDAMVRVHVLAPVRLTRAALPGMIASRRRCAVVNVSSVAAYGTSPGNVTYCATKAYLNSFTHGLALELRGTNVTVQALCPGYTKTELHDRADIAYSAPPSWSMMPQEVVEASLRCLARGNVVCVPRLQYKAVVALAHVIPGSARHWLKEHAQALLGKLPGASKP